MIDVLLSKIGNHIRLSADDAAILEQVCSKPQSVPARTDLVREGDKPGPIFVVLEGWACRYTLLSDGTRQITAFLMPGDCCPMHASAQETMDHAIATLTPARVTTIQRVSIGELIMSRPALHQAFSSALLVEEDTLRAWLVSMGRRDSLQRVAHLICELHVRARMAGRANNGRFEMPLTQATLGDALGLTGVHVNRILRKLRLRKLVDLSAGRLIIADVAKLAAVAGFNDNYLLRGTGRCGSETSWTCRRAA